MKHLLAGTAILIAITSCNSGKENKAGSSEGSTTAKERAITPPAGDTTTAPAGNADFPTSFIPGKIFTSDKADLHEQLKIQQLSATKIAYEIQMENGGCAPFTFRGIALLKEGDAESDTDAKGNGYFVDEFTDDKNGSCSVYIRIGADKGYTNLARFIVADCPKACKDKSDSELLAATK